MQVIKYLFVLWLSFHIFPFLHWKLQLVSADWREVRDKMFLWKYNKNNSWTNWLEKVGNIFHGKNKNWNQHLNIQCKNFITALRSSLQIFFHLLKVTDGSSLGKGLCLDKCLNSSAKGWTPYLLCPFLCLRMKNLQEREYSDHKVSFSPTGKFFIGSLIWGWNTILGGSWS